MSSDRSPDEIHRGFSRRLFPPVAEFSDLVYRGLSPEQRAQLPGEIGDYINTMVEHALNRLPEYGEALAETIFRVYEDSPHGERFILDPLRTDNITRSIVFLDFEGHLVSVKNAEIEWTSLKPPVLELRRYQSYLVLSGPHTGSRFYPTQRPLGSPVYKPGLIASWFKTGGIPLASPTPAAGSTPSSSPSVLKIFLCHSSGDKPAVRELYQRLLKDGFDPWLDEERLLPGQNWDLEIRRAIRATDIILVCLSTNSVMKRGYVQKEIKGALDIADELPEGSIFIIPARLDECEIPERLSEWHWVNLFEPRGYDRLVAALHAAAKNLGS